MGLQVTLAVFGQLNDFARQTHLRIARGARTAAEKFAARAKLAYRGEVRKGGLGDRVANTIRVDIYPRSADAHTHAPAVVVWTKAPAIIYAFATGVTIRHHDGLWLALPTENTPRRGQRMASPAEVEVIFNQDLVFFPGRGRTLLAFVDAVKAKSGKGFRRATSARTGRQSRKAELVLMFVLVPQVTLNKRLDFDRITANLREDWRELFGSEIAQQLAA
jgi:hypothetical protein